MYVLLRFMRTARLEDWCAAFDLLEEVYGAYIVGITSEGYLVFSTMLPLDVCGDDAAFLMVASYDRERCGFIALDAGLSSPN